VSSVVHAAWADYDAVLTLDIIDTPGTQQNLTRRTRDLPLVRIAASEVQLNMKIHGSFTSRDQSVSTCKLPSKTVSVERCPEMRLG
jgi:hypothetical protein